MRVAAIRTYLVSHQHSGLKLHTYSPYSPTPSVRVPELLLARQGIRDLRRGVIPHRRRQTRVGCFWRFPCRSRLEEGCFEIVVSATKFLCREVCLDVAVFIGGATPSQTEDGGWGSDSE